MNRPGSNSNRRKARPALLLGALILALALFGCADTPEELEQAANAALAKGDRVSAAIHFQSLVALEPTHAGAHLQLGKLLAESGALPQAEDSLKRALELGQPYADVAPTLGRVMLELEKYKDVLELLEPGPKRAQPVEPAVLAEIALLRARAHFGLGDLTSAGTQYRLAMGAQPGKAKLGLAGIAAAENDREGAVTLLKEALASDPQDADVHIALGDMRRTQGDPDTALKHYADAVKAQPGYAHALLTQAVALINASRVPEARPLLERAGKVTPASPMLHFAQALIECKERRYPQCREALQEVFKSAPQYMPAILLAAQMHYTLGDYELAQEALLRYLQRFPDNMHARKLLAATLLAKARPQAALNVLQPMLGASSTDAQALGMAGQALLQLGHVRQAGAALNKAVKLSPGEPEFRTALAMTHLAAGARQRAEAEFRAAVALKPPNAKAEYGLTMMMLAERRIDQAREVVTAVEQRLPKDPESHMLRGVVARVEGNLRAARLAFQRAAETDPAFFPAVEELAQMDAQEGNYDAARKRIQEVLRRNALHLDAMLAMAALELAAGQRPEGLSWARQAASAHPQSVRAMLALAETQLENGETNDAIASLRQTSKDRPNDARVIKSLGRMQMAAKDYASAIATFSSLASAQPGSPEAHLLLASAHLAANDLTAAGAAARNALQRDPRNNEARATLGTILLRGKRYSELTQFAKNLQRDTPRAALGFRLEAEALLAQGDARRAAKLLETAVKLEPSGVQLTRLHQVLSTTSPGSAPDAPLEDWVRNNPGDRQTRLYLADTLSARGRHKEAIAHYQELIRRDAKDARALNNLAWAMHATGDAKSVEYAERAYQLSPAEPVVLDTFGWVLVNRGRLDEGIQMLLKAVAQDGKNPEIRYHLAQALAQAGDKVRARAELKTVLAAGQSFPHAEEARALLGSLGQ